jgi:hypothetical protein
MNEPETLPAPIVDLPPPPDNKWRREHHAFIRLLPELLKTHKGKYVAIHEERLVESGDDKLEVAFRAYQKYGYVPIYVGLVTNEPIPVIRIPTPRVVRWERKP